MAVKPAGLSANAWAVKAGLNRNVFNDIRKRDSAHPYTLDALLDAIGLTKAEFDAGAKQADKEPPPQSVQAPRLAFRGDDRPRDIPIVGTVECADIDFDADGGPTAIETLGIDIHDVIDHARRPPSLDNRRDIYALYFRGHSMSPRYEPGEIAYVDPSRQPRIRDYVIVQLKEGGDFDGDRMATAMAKRLVRVSASYIELEQFNPPVTFKIERRQVAHMHRIIPWDEIVSF